MWFNKSSIPIMEFSMLYHITYMVLYFIRQKPFRVKKWRKSFECVHFCRKNDLEKELISINLTQPFRNTSIFDAIQEIRNAIEAFNFTQLAQCHWSIPNRFFNYNFIYISYFSRFFFLQNWMHSKDLRYFFTRKDFFSDMYIYWLYRWIGICVQCTV